MVKKPKNKKGIGPIKKGHILKDMTFFSLVGAEGFEPLLPTLMFTGFFLAYAFITNRITDHFKQHTFVNPKIN